MKTQKILLAAALFGSLTMCLTSCFENQDPGPIQEQEKEYSILDFDRLEIGDALNVTVTQGPMYSVKVKGDRRNIDDLEVKTIGTTLRMRFDNDRRGDNRQYTTYVTITMPALNGALFSGAVTSKISGFVSDGSFDLTLSGASTSQTDINASSVKLNLSGASELNLAGASTTLEAVVSGASELRGFDMEAVNATVEASGASKIRVLATQNLNATASGASDIRYRGNPVLNSNSSGASTIGAD